MAQNSNTQLLVRIHELIEDTFDLEEFRNLCFRLGVKYDHLRGENLPARIQSLVEMMHRRRRLGDLLNSCAQLRPNVEWPDLSDSVSLDARARQGRRQDRPGAFVQTLRRIPVWRWIGGGALAMFLVFQSANGGDNGNATNTPPEMLAAVSQATAETPTASAMTRPTDTQTPTSTPTDSPTHTGTPEPTNTPTPTITPLPTDTPTVTSTPTRTPTNTPTATSNPAVLFSLVSPTLNDNPSTGVTEFVWQWQGVLAENQGFEVRVWREGEPSQGIHGPVREKENSIFQIMAENTYRLTVDISNAPGVDNQNGEYNWTVLLVEINPYRELAEAPAGRLRFETTTSAEEPKPDPPP